MTETTTPQYTCEVCGHFGTYRRNYGTTLCNECVKFDTQRSVPAETTKKYLKKRS